MALAVLDRGSGWKIKSQPGEFGLCRGEFRLVPHELVRAVQRRDTTAANYVKLVAEPGIADLPPAQTLHLVIGSGTAAPMNCIGGNGSVDRRSAARQNLRSRLRGRR
jgi:hypothetical protein